VLTSLRLSSNFPDSMTTPWDAQKISTLLSDAFAPWVSNPAHPSSPKSAKAPPTASIDVLLTFDASGVSGHTNHTSLYHGAKAFIAALRRDRTDFACPVDLYTLTSVNVVRKFTSFVDVFATILGLSLLAGAESKKPSEKGNPGALVSCISMFGGRESVATARKAMTQAHVSQMVWFRWGWISLSRYMLINDLKLERSKS
jgi:N-acetylglucosaminylphosphatidylinositol deacetylase